jgi:hypothetical protein
MIDIRYHEIQTDGPSGTRDGGMEMVLDPRKRQQKLERKKAKDRGKAIAKKQQAVKAHVREVQSIGTGAILDVLIMRDFRARGMAQVVISRSLPHDRVVFASFLLDLFCLGVKDVVFETDTATYYRNTFLEKLYSSFDFDRAKPECARKLIEGAVDYAESLGLPPHPDYLKAKAIFGDIDPSQCQEDFEYGLNGKPFFVAGPYDTPARIAQVMNAIKKHDGLISPNVPPALGDE